jgi:subtilisin family serine protease
MHVFNGMAYDAKLAFFDIGVTKAPFLKVAPLYDVIFPAAVAAGAYVHSNSWGSNTQTTDEYFYDIDKLTTENSNFLPIFAAGNAGNMGYFSVGSPGLAKNTLTIGAAQNPHTDGFNEYNMAYFSSIGPTFDNRIKPEVVAPGYFTWSARASQDGTSNTCSMLSMAGTSMATPTVSGNTALVREYFEVRSCALRRFMTTVGLRRTLTTWTWRCTTSTRTCGRRTARLATTSARTSPRAARCSRRS